MTYTVKEIFYTLQGEGAHTGRPAVFCRFAGCNLWSGREQDRKNAICDFCDTDFVGADGLNGGKFKEADKLAEKVVSLWPQGVSGTPFVVCTGGEPLMQLDETLIDAFHAHGFEVAVETNGTLPAPNGLDWVCVSPKAGADFVQQSGDELKLIYPQGGVSPAQFENLSFQHFFLQPMDALGDAKRSAQNTQQAMTYCQSHPQWRLSLQTHKILGIP